MLEVLRAARHRRHRVPGLPHSRLAQLPRPLLARRTCLRGTWLTAEGHARLSRRRTLLTAMRTGRRSREARRRLARRRRARLAAHRRALLSSRSRAGWHRLARSLVRRTGLSRRQAALRWRPWWRLRSARWGRSRRRATLRRAGWRSRSVGPCLSGARPPRVTGSGIYRLIGRHGRALSRGFAPGRNPQVPACPMTRTTAALTRQN
ncbi:hypothetical protein [Saccharopolyspora spinosa]|uniref:hypothetical protein n=1 Tax=Saccharopolyspora spinosa TaxID=60894 RepID=UPI0037498703